MTTTFVRRSISLYRSMSEEMRVFYKNMLKLPGDSTLMNVENALTRYEAMKNNVHELIEEMEEDVAYFKTAIKTKK